MRCLISSTLGVLLACIAAFAYGEEIAVGNYGVSANGMPFGVALVKGYFKDEGLNITGLISSAGGRPAPPHNPPGGGGAHGRGEPGGRVFAGLARGAL